MRITARQLRQIIKEELARNLREQDDMEQPVVSMPPAKKKGIFGGIFGPGETPADEIEWDNKWSELSQGEKDIYVAGVKRDPNLATIAGAAVRNGEYNDGRFLSFLMTPYPMGGSRMFESLLGDVRPGGLSIGKAAAIFASRFKDNETRVRFFQTRLGMHIHGAPKGTASDLDLLVYENRELAAALERIFFEGFPTNSQTGGLDMPRPDSQLEAFVFAAMGV